MSRENNEQKDAAMSNVTNSSVGWKRWLGCLVAALLFGTVVFGFNAAAARFTPGVNIALVAGWWAFVAYFTGTMHHN